MKTRSKTRGTAALRGAIHLRHAIPRLLLVSALETARAASAQQAPAAVDANPVQLPPVVVSGKATFTLDQTLQAEGTQAKGYVPETVSAVGALGSMKILDTPYSIGVMPLGLIQNVQPSSPQTLFDMNPLIQVTQPEATAVTTKFESRGFKMDSAEDGLRFTQNINFGPIPIEDKERIETVSGLGAFLYGATDPGGMVNYVLKRPTAGRLTSITTGYYGGSGYVHGDFGGPIDPDGKLGYRFNIVDQSGSQPVDDQSIQRTLFSGALDWHATDHLLFQVDASHQDYRLDGPTTIWNLSGLNIAPPDASKNWGEDFTRQRFSDTNAGARMQWDITDDLTFRAGYKYYYNRSDSVGAQNLTISPNGNYNQFINRLANQIESDQAGYASLDAKFATGFIQHKLTLGFFGNKDYGSVPLDNNPNVSVPGFNIFDPDANGAAQQAAAIALSKLTTGNQPDAYFLRDLTHNEVIGDVMQFNDRLSAIVGGTYSTIHTENYTKGVLSSGYARSKFTPSVSLVFKPLQNVSTYATYMEGLESGGIATLTSGGLPVTNPGQAAPTTDRQYEIGAKANLGDSLVTFALFDIDKASEVYLENAAKTAVTFSNSGREVHKGAELTYTGKLTRDITLYGGLTAFDAHITDQPANPALVGKRPQGVSTFMAKLYAEYAIRAVPGFSVNGGFQYYNGSPITANNSSSTPGYIIGNLGARYETMLYHTATVFRLNVYNIANKNYWVNEGNGTAAEGIPRSVMATVQFTL